MLFDLQDSDCFVNLIERRECPCSLTTKQNKPANLHLRIMALFQRGTQLIETPELCPIHTSPQSQSTGFKVVDS
jgi:hypothetical protein